MPRRWRRRKPSSALARTARSQLPAHVPGRQQHVARDHFPHHPGRTSHANVRRREFHHSRFVRESHGQRRMGVDGCWYGNRLKPQAYMRYDATNDKRASFIYTTGQTLAVASISDFGDGYLAPKFQNVTSDGKPGSNPGFVDTDFPVFRLGEAYLIYAEAAVRGGGGDLGQALTYVNALRQRAYGNTSGNITGGAAQHAVHPRRARSRAALGGSPSHRSRSVWPLHGRKLHLVVEGRHRSPARRPMLT